MASSAEEIKRQPPKEFRNNLRQRGYKFGVQVDQKDQTDFLQYIGSGGFGSVFRIYKADNTPVALKYTKADSIVNRFTPLQDPIEMEVMVDELQKLTEMRHPFVIRYLEAFTVDNDLGNGKKAWKMAALVMEFCDGHTLQTEIDSAYGANCKIAIDRLRRWFLQLALALEYVHYLGYVHLGVKPENVFLKGSSGTEHAVLGNFGTNRSFPECINGMSQANFEDVHFLSPERLHPANGDKWRPVPYDDVWAYGVTLYCTAVLRYPFVRDNINTEAKPLAHQGKPAALSSLVERLLVIEPEDRLNMEQVVRDEFFADSLLDRNTLRKCTDNLRIHVKRELERGYSMAGADRILDGLWLSAALKAFEDFSNGYYKWKEIALNHFVSTCEAEAKIIRQQETTSHIGQITGGATGIVGGGMSLAGIAITVTGTLAPLGIPLTIAGAAVGGAGALTAGGSAVAGVILENKEMKKIKTKQDEVRKLDENLAELLNNVVVLFPDKDLEGEIGHEIDVRDSFVNNVNVVTRVARLAFQAGDAGADVVTLVAKTAAVTTARTVSYILLPIGFALDTFTIVSSSVRLNKSDAADYLEALCVVLKSKDVFIQEIIAAMEQQIATKKQLLKKCNFERSDTDK